MSDEIKELKKQLFSTKKNGYDKLDAAELSAMEAYSDRYKAFLDAGKTERLCAAETVEAFEAEAYDFFERLVERVREEKQHGSAQ